MKLSIIIPQYQEKEEIIKPLLSSIETQIGVNLKKEVEIIIINDGSDCLLSSVFLQSFAKLNINYVKCKENNGPSRARNKGLEIAKGDYIIFCDADDRFLTNNALLSILNEINQNPADFYVWDFLEEQLLNDNMLYLNHSGNFIFIHAKVYSRQFLFYNNIRFNEELKVNEDSYFNGLCRSISKNIRIMPIPIYVWCYNALSISRKDNFNIKQFKSLIRTATKLVEELINRQNVLAKSYAVQFIFHVYFKMQTREWHDEKYKSIKDDVEKEYFIFYNNFKNLLAEANMEEVEMFYNQERNTNMLRGQGIEEETFKQFITRISCVN